MKLSKQEQFILDLIPYGAHNAISSKKIAEKTGINRRTVRAIIEKLVSEYYFPIGSSSSGDAGYFKIVTEEDFEIAQRHLKPRALKIFKRWRALQKIAAEKFSKQISFEEMIS